MCQFQLANVSQCRGQRWLWWKLVSGGGVKNRVGSGARGLGCRDALKTNLYLFWLLYSRYLVTDDILQCVHNFYLKNEIWSWSLSVTYDEKWGHISDKITSCTIFISNNFFWKGCAQCQQCLLLQSRVPKSLYFALALSLLYSNNIKTK